MLITGDAVADHLVEQRLETAAAIERRVVHDHIRAGRDGHYGVDVEEHFILIGPCRRAAVNLHLAELIDLRRGSTDQAEKIAHVAGLEGVELHQPNLLAATVKRRHRGRYCRASQLASRNRYRGGTLVGTLEIYKFDQTIKATRRHVFDVGHTLVVNVVARRRRYLDAAERS